MNEPKYAYRVMHRLDSGRRIFGRLYDSAAQARSMRTRMINQGFPEELVFVLQYSLTERMIEGVDH